MPAQKQNSLTDQVFSTIKRYNMLQPQDKLVVAVSGGPDSVALLYILQALRAKLGLKLYIAHLDHMLRPDSHKDLLFVQGLAKKLNLPISSGSLAVKKLVPKGSLEEACRKIRFDFLFKVAKKIGVKKIALGHNLDDQAETVLMRILRGTGLSGLSAILPKRKIEDLEIIRPLIETKRKDIESFLKKKKIKFRLDISNLENVFLRNRIRNRLLPLLEKEYNPNIKEILANMAENVALDYDYLRRMTKKNLKKLFQGQSGNLKVKGKYKLNLNKFSQIHPALQKMVLRMIIEDLKGNTRRLTYHHWKEIACLLKDRPFGAIVDLPQHIALQKKKQYLTIYLKN